MTMPSSKTNQDKPAIQTQEIPDLASYEIIVAVSGGIAAYKVCEVVSRLVQRGAGVTVAMTRAARRFVTPLTFQALSGRPVLTDLWKTGDDADIQHINITTRADLLLVAPATANTIGKIAAGLADDVVTNLVISADSTVILAPAMNNRMWANRAVQRNVATVRADGLHIVGPGEGWLACRSVGPGRMVEAAELVEAVAVELKAHPPKQFRG
jgi:phosphopantothenoylcysteine decarboxylase/phosphopantothenate--cysteine ligase